MRLVNDVTRPEINRALEEVHNELQRLRGRGGLSMQGDIDLAGHVVSNSGTATRSQDLVTKGSLDAAVETTNTTIINQAGASAWLIVNEQLSGTADGSNTTFTLAHEVLGGNKIALFDNYVRLKKITGTPDAMEYALSAQTATLGSAPSSGARVSADYLTPRPASPVFDEVPSGTKNGVNTTFTLAYDPSAESDVSVYSNGILAQRVDAGALPPDQYTITGQTLTLGWAPLSTDDLKADYPVRAPGDIRWNDDLYGDKNGVNTTYTLDEEPLGERIAVYRSHVRLTRVASGASGSLEYSISRKTITMGSAPSSDEPLYANYQVPSGGEVLHSGPGFLYAGSEILDVVVTTAVDFEFVTGREPATLDHGDLSGLADDDHTQYALLAGRAGGQTLIGGTAAADDLTLCATAGVGVGSEAIIFQGGSNGAMEFGRFISASGTTGKLGLGTTTAANAERLELALTSTATSGARNALFMESAANPSGASSETIRGAEVRATVTDGNTSNITGNVVGMLSLVRHLGDSNLTGLIGGQFNVTQGPLLGAESGTSFCTDLLGLQLQAQSNADMGAAATAMATRAHGASFLYANLGRGTVATGVAGIFAISIQDANAIITNAFAGRFGGILHSGTDLLTAGTITNGTMVEIGDWTSGPTYTNPPVQLKLLASTPANGIGIYQDGTGAYNKYEGFSMLGADGAPESPLEVNSTSALAQQLVTLDQDDTDQPFIDFQGNTGADATASISTRTVATINGYIQIEINGTKKWIAYYNDPTA